MGTTIRDLRVTVQTGPIRSINFDNDYNRSQIEMIPEMMPEKVERACKVDECKKIFFMVSWFSPFFAIICTHSH